MTDRELLELAAKAHGKIPARVIGAKPGLYAIDEPLMPAVHYQWNSLTDIADAARLSIILRMNVFHTGGKVYAMESDATGDIESCESYSDNGGDEEKAYCRAITRCAAEIGKGMQ